MLYNIWTLEDHSKHPALLVFNITSCTIRGEQKLHDVGKCGGKVMTSKYCKQNECGKCNMQLHCASKVAEHEFALHAGVTKQST